MGNPTQFYLTPGQVYDLQGVDVLLPGVEASAFLADKAYYAQERVIAKLEEKNCAVVIPSKYNRIEPRDYDQHLYKARHLIENFFVKLKQYRAIATRYDKIAVNFFRCYLSCFCRYLAYLMTRPNIISVHSYMKNINSCFNADILFL